MFIQIKKFPFLLPTGNFNCYYQNSKNAENYLATIPTNTVLIRLLTLTVAGLCLGIITGSHLTAD